MGKMNNENLKINEILIKNQPVFGQFFNHFFAIFWIF